MAHPILPSQVRSARALIDWSQERLAHESGVSISTIRDFESGRRDPARENLQAIVRTLAAIGAVRFLSEDENLGPGVRLTKDSAKMIKGPTHVSFDSDNLPFKVRWNETEIFVFLPALVLDDLSRTSCENDQQYLGQFKKWQAEILRRTTLAIYGGRVDDKNRLQLRTRDFEDLF